MHCPAAGETSVFPLGSIRVMSGNRSGRADRRGKKNRFCHCSTCSSSGAKIEALIFRSTKGPLVHWRRSSAWPGSFLTSSMTRGR